MNFKLVSVAAALAVSAAVAQDYEDEYEESSAPAAAEEQAEEAAPAPAPAPAAPAADDSWNSAPAAEAPAAAQAPATGFNVLHSNAYNVVGNEGGAATIGGDMAMPHKMAGRTLLYVQPSAREGVLSLAKGGMTYLLEYRNAGTAQLTAGIATGGIGITVDLALDKTFNSTETSVEGAGSTEQSESITGAGDNIGVNFSTGLGAFDLGLHARWLTFRDETDTETDNTETDEDYWDIEVGAVISNAPSARGVYWSAGLSFDRHASTVEESMGNSSVETTNDDSYFEIVPSFNIAFMVASVANAQLFLGTNTRLPITIYDEIKDDNETNNRMEFGLITTPNILAEVSLNDNWMFFGGARFQWNVIDYKSDETKRTGRTTDKSKTTLNTTGAEGNVGARFAYKNFSLEASVSQTGSLDNFAGNLGAFINF